MIYILILVAVITAIIGSVLVELYQRYVFKRKYLHVTAVRWSVRLQKGIIVKWKSKVLRQTILALLLLAKYLHVAHG
ncbi:MAG: hypothetical protein COA78_22000 [Blastopirellula sp.]|nr:MAG: hypothetical protein COA78_22000 [Blastopirellula sp.]